MQNRAGKRKASVTCPFHQRIVSIRREAETAGKHAVGGV